MSRFPTISVITTSFNQARYLERTICSVLDQGYEGLEYIVVDGGSCDETVEILRSYENDLAWWVSSPDDGPAEAINKALKHVTGEVLAFLSSDNLYLPFTLHRVAERFRRSDRPNWLIGRSDMIDGEDRQVKTARLSLPRDLNDLLRGSHDPVASASTFYKTAVVREFGPFDQSLMHHFDFDFNCRLMASGIRPALVDEILAAQRRHTESLRIADVGSHRRERRQLVRHYRGVAADLAGSNANSAA